MINTPCDNHPDRPSAHTVAAGGKVNEYCCACHLENGGAPADWHPNCMNGGKPILTKKRRQRMRLSKKTMETIVWCLLFLVLAALMIEVGTSLRGWR